MEDAGGNAAAVLSRCAILEKITRAALALLAVVTAGYLVYGVIVFFTPPESFSFFTAEGATHIINDSAGLMWGNTVPAWALPAGAADFPLKEMQLMNTLLSALLMLAPLFTMALSLLFMLRRVRERGTPFSPENAQNLRCIGWVLAAQGFFMRDVWRLAVTLVFYQGRYLSLFAHIDWGKVIAGALILAVALVFEYGADLQRKCGETR